MSETFYVFCFVVSIWQETTSNYSIKLGTPVGRVTLIEHLTFAKWTQKLNFSSNKAQVFKFWHRLNSFKQSFTRHNPKLMQKICTMVIILCQCDAVYLLFYRIQRTKISQSTNFIGNEGIANGRFPRLEQTQFEFLTKK